MFYRPPEYRQSSNPVTSGRSGKFAKDGKNKDGNFFPKVVKAKEIDYNHDSDKERTGDLFKIHNFLISLIPGAQLGWVFGVWTPLPFSAKERICPFCRAIFISMH